MDIYLLSIFTYGLDCVAPAPKLCGGPRDTKSKLLNPVSPAPACPHRLFTRDLSPPALMHDHTSRGLRRHFSEPRFPCLQRLPGWAVGVRPATRPTRAGHVWIGVFLLHTCVLGWGAAEGGHAPCISASPVPSDPAPGRRTRTVCGGKDDSLHFPGGARRRGAPTWGVRVSPQAENGLRARHPAAERAPTRARLGGRGSLISRDAFCSAGWVHRQYV